MTDALRQQRARQHEKSHNILFLVKTFYSIVLLVAFLWSGTSRRLAVLAPVHFAVVVIVGMKLAVPANPPGGAMATRLTTENLPPPCGALGTARPAEAVGTAGCPSPPLGFALLVVLLLAGCIPKPPSEIDWQAFNGKKAYAHAERLVSYGPRPTASPALIKTATYIGTQLQENGLDAEEQVFVAATPRGPLQFRNVIGRTRTRRGSTGKIIIIASHYDTKFLPHIGFVGANDGASSTAALLEMARVVSGVPDLWFVFFDGEECVKEYGPNDGLWGSTYFVEDLKGQKRLDRIQAMVLLDMVGDKDLNIVMPANSHRALVQRVFDAAKATGHRDYFSFGEQATMDDHVPFAIAGVPSVDIIDLQFGSAPGLNDYWHTDKDTLDKISPRSLEIVGQTALRLLDSLRKQPKL